MLEEPGLSEPARCPQLRHAPVLALLALAFAAPAGAPAAFAAAAQAAPKGWPEGAILSPDDRGFAIVLTSPVDPWLHGRQTLKVEAMIPHDDSLDQVDFFVDRHLVFVDTDEPFTTTYEFGPEIRRHTIEVKALTHEGRRARVSFVSRSADLAEDAPGRVVTLTALVRDTAGRPVDRLDVSDFAVSEGMAPQSIVHFMAAPAPSSIALVVDPAVAVAAKEPLARFLRQLPPHQAIALFGPDGSATPAREPAAAPSPAETEASLRGRNPGDTAKAAGGKQAAGKEPPAPPRAEPSLFSYDVATIVARLDGPGSAGAEAVPAETHASSRKAAGAAPAAAWPELLDRAAAALAARRGPRLLILVGPIAPFGDEPLGPALPAALKEAIAGRKESAVAAALSAPAGKPPAPGAKTPPEPDPLTAAIEAARESGAALRVLALPAPPDRTWSEAKAAERALEEAAGDTGGFYDAPTPTDAAAIDRALDAVTETLRHQYIVSYVSNSPPHAGWKPLKVEVRGRDRALEAPRSVFLGD
jgi:hypothetical protein